MYRFVTNPENNGPGPKDAHCLLLIRTSIGYRVRDKSDDAENTVDVTLV